MIALFLRQLSREWIIHLRQLRTIANSSLFFLMVMIFFPLTMPADSALLRTMLPGLVWIGVLLAILLASERLFQQEEDDGVVEQWLVSGYPISLYIFAKVLLHWLFMIGPVLLFCPCLAMLFSLSAYEMSVVVLSLLAGTPAIQFLCALAAAFGIGLRQKGVLMALVLLPLTIPVMIFGSGVITAAMQGSVSIIGYLAILLAMSLVAMLFLPLAIGGVLK